MKRITARKIADLLREIDTLALQLRNIEADIKTLTETKVETTIMVSIECGFLQMRGNQYPITRERALAVLEAEKLNLEYWHDQKQGLLKHY